MSSTNLTIERDETGTFEAGKPIFLDFSLDPTIDPYDAYFVHFYLELNTPTIIYISKNGLSFPLNNGAPLVGEIYRSIPLIARETVNMSLSTAQISTGKAKLLLESPKSNILARSFWDRLRRKK